MRGLQRPVHRRRGCPKPHTEIRDQHSQDQRSPGLSLQPVPLPLPVQQRMTLAGLVGRWDTRKHQACMAVSKQRGSCPLPQLDYDSWCARSPRCNCAIAVWPRCSEAL